MGNLLYKVSPRDPVAFGSAFLVITISSFAAVLIPALRAAGTDPARALRE
jgi:ABC-type lipoprotein release transport system permease subunit